MSFFCSCFVQVHFSPSISQRHRKIEPTCENVLKICLQLFTFLSTRVKYILERQCHKCIELGNRFQLFLRIHFRTWYDVSSRNSRLWHEIKTQPQFGFGGAGAKYCKTRYWDTPGAEIYELLLLSRFCTNQIFVIKIHLIVANFMIQGMKTFLSGFHFIYFDFLSDPNSTASWKLKWIKILNSALKFMQGSHIFNNMVSNSQT